MIDTHTNTNTKTFLDAQIIVIFKGLSSSKCCVPIDKLCSTVHIFIDMIIFYTKYFQRHIDFPELLRTRPKTPHRIASNTL